MRFSPGQRHAPQTTVGRWQGRIGRPLGGAPSRRLRRFTALLGAALALGACGDLERGDPVEDRAQPIIGGQLDTVHDAVVLLLGENHLCSGTIIDVDPATGVGYALTAGHCVEDEPLLYAGIGQDQDSIEDEFAIDESWIHPEWELQRQIYDLALVRLLGVGVDTPVIPVVGVQDDDAGIGDPVTSVGWGITQPNQNQASYTPTRRAADRSIADADDVWIIYSGTDQPICDGDSGGPVLYQTPAGERVLAVHSASSEGCSEFGLSIRVTSVVDSFINSILENGEDLSCSSCVVAESLGDGPCGQANDACVNDAECNTFEACASNCTSALCESQCANQYPNGAALSVALTRCLCEADACGERCGCSDWFGQCGLSPSSEPSCAECGEVNCCAEAEACQDDGACALCSSDDPACADNPARDAWAGCMVDACATECGIDVTPVPPVATGTTPTPILTGTRGPPPTPPGTIDPQPEVDAGAGDSPSMGGAAGVAAGGSSATGGDTSGGAAGSEATGGASGNQGLPEAEPEPMPADQPEPEPRGSPDEDATGESPALDAGRARAPNPAKSDTPPDEAVTEAEPDDEAEPDEDDEEDRPQVASDAANGGDSGSACGLVDAARSDGSGAFVWSTLALFIGFCRRRAGRREPRSGAHPAV